MLADQTVTFLEKDLVIAQQGYFLSMDPSKMAQEDT